MKKSVITLLIFLIMIISVTAVSAADDASDLGAADTDALSIDNTDTATADANVKNFTVLSADIAKAGDVNLGSDYIRNGSSESGIAVDITTKTVDGHGFTIDANGTGYIFEIPTGNEVTLKNVILKNANNYAIKNQGVLTLDNVTFINCTYSGSNLAVNSVFGTTLTVNNCIFNDCGIAFSGNSLSLSGNTLLGEANIPLVKLYAGQLMTESTIYTTGTFNSSSKKNSYIAAAYDDAGNGIAIFDGWTVTINGQSVDATATDGFVNASANATKFGLQEITATNSKLTNPQVVAGSVNVKPDAQDSTIAYSLSNTSAIVYNDCFNITLSISNLYKLTNNVAYYPTSTFTIKNNAVEYGTATVNETTGVATLEVKNITRGNYAFSFKYNGDSVYNPAEITGPSFIVGARSITDADVNVTVTQLEKGEQVIDIIFPSDVTGTVTANVTNYPQYNITSKELNNGKVSLNTNFVDYQAYDLNIALVSTNPNYSNYEGTKTFNVNKLNTTVTIEVENSTYDGKTNVTFKITLDKGVTNATYQIGSAAEVNVPLVNGSATVNLGPLAAGNYTITVKPADGNYSDTISNVTTFEVARAVPTVTLVVGDAVLFKPVQANVTVKFGAENGTGNVKLYVNGEQVDIHELDTNGTYSFTINDKIKAGENTVTAVMVETTNYTEANATKTFTVNQVTPTITVTLTDDVNITKDAVLNIAVQEGAAIAPTGFVTVKLGDKTYPTDSTIGKELVNGVATITIPAADINEVKQYSVEVAYNPNGNVNYTANSTVFKFNVTYWNYVIEIEEPIANVTVGNNITFNVNATGAKAFSNNFTVAIIDADGNVVNKTSVKLLNTGAQVQVQFNLTKGVYTAVLAYAGDNNYDINNTVSKEFSVQGIIENLTIGIENVTYPNKPVAIVNASVDGDYNVTVNNKNYTVTVSGGTGSVTIDEILGVATYDANVISTKSDYVTKTSSTSFIVKPGKVEGVTLTIDAVTYPNKAIAIVSAPVNGNYTIKSKSGLINPGNVSVVNGTGNITLDLIGEGSYTFAVWTPSDNVNYTSYEAATAVLVVNKGNVVVNLTVEDVLYNNTAKAVINVTVGGYYNISLINATGVVIASDIVKFNDGEEKTIPAPVLIPGTYTVNVTATIANYNPVEISKTFEVKTGIVYYNVTIADYTYDPNVQGTITLETNVNGTIGKGYAIYLGDVLLGNVTGDATNKTVQTGVLAAGEYTVKVIPFADDPAFKYYNLGSQSNSTTFKVNRATASFDVEVTETVKYPGNVTLKIKDSNFTGNYTIKVGVIVDDIVNVTAGQVREVNLTDIPVGVYTASVTSDNANYTVVSKDAVFSVVWGPITPTVANVETYYNSPAVVNITSNADGAYVITINGKEYPVNVVNGNGSVVIPDVLAVDTYNIKLVAEIEGYVKYINDTIATLTVKQAGIGVSINVTEVTYPDNVTATVTANVTGVYTITVSNGTEVAKYNVTITTETGKFASESVVLDVLRPVYGPYTAEVKSVKYDTANFTEGTNQTNIVVNKATPVIIIDILESYSIYDEIVINITVANADAPDTVKIKCDLVGTDWQAPITLVNGSANYTISKDKVTVFGTHVVYAEVVGGDFVAGIFNQTAFEVTPITPELNITFNNASFKEDAIVNISFANLKAGVDVPTGTLVIVDFGSQTLAGDKNYTFNLGSNLAGGEHVLNISYISNNTIYNSVNVLYTIKIKQLSPVVKVTEVTGGTYPSNATVTFTTDTDGLFTIDIIDADGVIVKTIDAGSLNATKSKTENITGLDAGKYTANVTYVANENYTSVTNTSAVFEIAKAANVINASVANVVYPNAAIAVINTEQAGNYEIIVTKGGIQYYKANGTLVAGENSVKFDDVLAAGDYSFAVIYENKDYVSEPVTGNFTVIKGIANITIDVADVVYPHTAVVNITSSADGDYNVTIDDFKTNGTFKAGEVVTIDLPKLAADSYAVVVDYAGNDNYNASAEYKIFIVDKYQTVIYMFVNNTDEIGKESVVEVLIPYATGNVTINGQQVELTHIPVLNSGYATFSLGALKAETYDITAIYYGNENTTYGDNFTSFTVSKLPANLVVTVTNTTFGEDPEMNITLDNKDDLIVRVSIDGTADQFIEIKNGTKTGHIPNLGIGEHNVTVTYDGSDIYEAESVTLYFTIDKAEVNMNITGEDVNYPEYVVVTVVSDVSGNYSLFLDVTSPLYITLVANEPLDVDFGTLPAGTYEFTLAYLGSETYSVGVVSTNVTVAKAENTTMIIDATSPVAGENATITVVLPDDATGTVEVKYGDGVYTAPVEYGIATISVPTNVAGSEVAQIKYSGDNNYPAASGEVNITVQPAPTGIIIAENIKRGVNSPYDYYATLVDADGKPISGVEITFTIVGQTFKAITNESGIATVSAGLGLVEDKDTKYDVIVTNPYTLENITATTTIVPRLIVISGDLTADYLENPPYVVQAIGDDGNPVGAGETVRVVFAGFYYDLQTNATGHVVRTIGLAPGMYAVKACYEGYNTTATVFTVKQVMKVTSGTLKKTAKSYTLKATLKSSNGKAIVGKEVKLTFNGKTYTVKTNSKGVASYTIKSSVISKLKAGKTYELKAKYVNDVTKGKIKVVKK